MGHMVVRRITHPEQNWPGGLSRPISLPLLFLSAIVCPWLDFGLPPQCPQVVWCHWGRLSHFLSRWLRADWQRSAREKFLEIFCHSWELNPAHREDRFAPVSLLITHYEEGCLLSDYLSRGNELVHDWRTTSHKNTAKPICSSSGHQCSARKADWWWMSLHAKNMRLSGFANVCSLAINTPCGALC